jgi:hypothetical protein
MDKQKRVPPCFAAQMAVSPHRGDDAEPDDRASLRNWYRDADDRLHGDVYGHPRFPDGTRIATTMVQDQYRTRDALLAKAWHTVYELTGPDGETWFPYVEAERSRRRGRTSA